MLSSVDVTVRLVVEVVNVHMPWCEGLFHEAPTEVEIEAQRQKNTE